MRKLPIVLGVGVAVVLAVLVVLFMNLRASSLVSADTKIGVTIDKNGSVFEGNTRITRFRQNDTSQSADIPLAGLGDAGSITTRLELTFVGTNAKDSVTVIPISLEGDGPFASRFISESVLLVSVIDAAVDGKPLLRLVAPVDSFEIPVLYRGIDWLSRLPLLGWGVGVALAWILVLLYVLIRTRRVSWKSKKVRIQPPGDMRPIELAILHHGEVTHADLTALLFDLAQRGYLVMIEHEDGDSMFLRTSKTDGLASYELNFLLVLFPEEQVTVHLDTIFERLNRSLFSAVVSQLYVEIYDSFASRGFLEESPRQIHIRYKTVGIAVQLLGLLIALISFLLLLAQAPGLVIVGVGCYLAGVVLYQAGYRVIPLSRLGHALVDEAAEFRQFLRSRDLLPQDSSNTLLFYQFVPYAISLGCLNEWRDRFRDYKRWYVPDWYTNSEDSIVGPESYITHVTAIGNSLSTLMSNVKDPNVD